MVQDEPTAWVGGALAATFKPAVAANTLRAQGARFIPLWVGSCFCLIYPSGLNQALTSSHCPA